MNGAKNWYFADGYLPAKSAKGTMEAHEALMLLNCGTEPVPVRIDIYFSDRPPIREIALTIPAERIITLRLDHPADLNGHEIPELTQYALRVRAARNLVVQFGRLDTTQNNMAYYVGTPFFDQE